MADPLSITASAIAVVGAVGKACDTVQKLWSLRHADQDLIELRNEVSTFNDVVKSVQQVLQLIAYSTQDSTGTTSLLHRLEDVCNQAMGPLDELRNLSETKLVRRQQGQELQASKRNWMWQKKLVNRLRDKIKTSKESVSLLLLVLVVHGIVQQMQMERIASEVSPNQKLLQFSTVGGLSASARGEIGIQFNCPQIEMSNKRVLKSENCLRGPHGQPISDTLSKAATEKLRRCERFCPCRCHHCLQIRSPSWLACALGSLVWRTNFKVTLARQSCDRPHCLRTSPMAFRLSYIAPKWMLMAALHFQLVGVGIGGPHANLRPIRVVPRDTAVWPLVQCGAIDKLQQLFEKGEFCPFDILDDGTSLLHYAGMNGQVDTCSFLIESGADKYFQDCHGIAAIQPGLDKFLIDNTFDTSNAGIFVQETFSDEQDFTFLHKVALGICRPDLRSLLHEKVILDLDVRDVNRRTPLLWAAWIGNADCVQLLVEYEAGVDHLDLENESALSKACKAGHVTCAEMLLQAGASVNKGNCYHIQPIHYASQQQHHVATRLINALLKHGASVNASTDSSATPLHFAASSGIVENVNYLLKHNASLQARDASSMDASLIALANWHNELFCYLVKIGAEVNMSLKNGLNVLHIAAWGGSCESWAVIAEAARDGRLCGIDINSRHDGHTAAECLGNCRKFRSQFNGEAEAMEINNIKQILGNIRRSLTGLIDVKIKCS